MNFLCKSRVIFLWLPAIKTRISHTNGVWVALCEWHSVSNKVNVTKSRRMKTYTSLREKKYIHTRWLPFTIANLQWTQGEPHIYVGLAGFFFLQKLFTHLFLLTAELYRLCCYTQSSNPSVGCQMIKKNTQSAKKYDEREKRRQRRMKWMQNGNHDFSFQLLQYIYCVNVSMCWARELARCNCNDI